MPASYLINAGGGNTRTVYDGHLHRTLREAGYSSLSGLGASPNGASVSRAARESGSGRQGDVVLRIIGYLQQSGQYDPRYDNIPGRTVLSRVVYRRDILDALAPLSRGAGGSGNEQDTRHLPGDTDASYGNTFLRAMSELTGFRWEQIDTVQIFV